MAEHTEAPQDGDKDSFACDGCGYGIETVYRAAEGLWVGDYVTVGDGLIMHPACAAASGLPVQVGQ